MKRSREKFEKICQHCGKVYFVPAYRKDNTKYCSRKCLALAARIPTTTVCEVCGTKFSHIASRANKAKYCSTKCYHIAQSTKGTIEYTCQHCGKKFLAAPSHKRKFCSKACVNKSAKEIFIAKYTTVRKQMICRNMLIKCEKCGYDQYPQILGVHHKDRNRNSSVPANLIILCPTCHSIEHMKHISHCSG